MWYDETLIKVKGIVWINETIRIASIIFYTKVYKVRFIVL